MFSRGTWDSRSTFSSSIAYFDSYRAATLPQNLLQAQRDYLEHILMKE